jgi:acyl carrier protein
MSGYEGNPEATASAFSAGWFRTGDQGYIDGEGYLFITGRLKELINRGGEKIAPREIDEALFAHPAVQLAVSFAVPHASLGEDVAAAVVLKANSLCSESELRAFLLDRLPAFKVPSQIVFVEDVPKGPTGKIQRIGLANRLAHFLEPVYEAPVSEMEERIAKAIEQVLCLQRVGRLDNFFALGGDSLRATQVISRLEQTLGVQLPTPLLFRFPTTAELGSHLDQFLISFEIEALADALAELTPEEQARLLDETLSPANAKLPTSAQPLSSPV